jgi:HTH-type transcriptional regulator / antitoxin MqsA
MNNISCPMCTTGKLIFLQNTDEIQYKNQTLIVEVEYASYDQCAEEMILPEQIKRNDCRVRDAWRKADGLLTGEEIVELRYYLGITQQQASKIFGGGLNAFSKYERGEVIQSEAMDKLMRIAREKESAFRWLKNYANSENKIATII